MIIFSVVCVAIEMLQYLEVYNATFDPWDLAAYISLLLPLFLVDIILSRKSKF